MQIFEHLEDWRKLRAGFSHDLKIGFVPTMGALHAGHASLLEQARHESDVLVLSIFVNPTQFNNPNDLALYPSTLESDFKLARKAGADYVLLPDTEQIYPDKYTYKVIESNFSHELCGAHRPGHFDGVLTVVMRLLNLVRPYRAYFGEKDYQQLELVKGMAKAFFMNVEIVAGKTVRADDGLALSSRNTRLSVEGRERARLFPMILQAAADAEAARVGLAKEGFDVDYVVDHDHRRFGAVTIENVRLIDNVEL